MQSNRDEFLRPVYFMTTILCFTSLDYHSVLVFAFLLCTLCDSVILIYDNFSTARWQCPIGRWTLLTHF